MLYYLKLFLFFKTHRTGDRFSSKNNQGLSSSQVKERNRAIGCSSVRKNQQRSITTISETKTPHQNQWRGYNPKIIKTSGVSQLYPSFLNILLNFVFNHIISF